jgi:Aminopeptidase N
LNCLSEDWLASQETLDEKLRFYLANELIRKLSLTWFGGSITAKWWNDLWIHEGLSTFLSYHILANSEDFKYKYPNSWFYFFFEKERAYYQDQLSIIHAVAHDVYSTHQAENIQDGIIREKAAAALKQLITAIGIDTFQDALKQLIKEYHSKNIELRDFMKCLQDSLNNRGIEADISRWEAQWLKSPGLNEIEVFADIEEGQLTGINIVQTVATRNLVALRDHRCKLAFFYDNAEESIHSVEITDETITSIELPRMTKPVGILLNYDDEDYVKLRFDRVSFNYFKRSLHVNSEIKILIHLRLSKISRQRG